MTFLNQLQSNILIGDGAMGTQLYALGVDQCFEELNRTHPEMIVDVHEKYVNAGADMIQTNSYAANAIKLDKYGLSKQVKDINYQSVKLAKQASHNDTYIFGTIGGIRRFQLEEVGLEEIRNAFKEQAEILLESGVDGLLLETFYDLEEAKLTVELARNLTSLPIVMNISLGEIGVLNGGIPVTEAFKALYHNGADVVGLNCRMGPYHMLRSFETVPIPNQGFLAAYPNASLPDFRDGRVFYQSNADYFQSMGKKFIEQGVRLLGGCCGTTPEHIAAFAKVKKEVAPITSKVVRPLHQILVKDQIPSKIDKPLPEIVKERHSVIVELDPPKKLSTEGFMQGAKALKDAGVDAITMADNSLASPRVDNLSLGSMVKQQLSARPLVHITCRDRNLIGLQSHLMGLHALGMNDILAITGDPTKVGDFPGATSVYDLTSFQLIQLIKQLNDGISFSGKELGEKSQFSVGAAFNPNVKYLDKAVKRLEKKIESGADYFMTQPIYNEAQIEALYHETKHLSHPIYVGIMPLTNSRNAEFLHNEVPGIKLTDEIRSAMATCGEDRTASTQEGLSIAKSLIDTTLEYFNGIYLITPFLRYEMTVELKEYIDQKAKSTRRV
ncbi:bifunctional homocysteine S-methyltransferase/methylenetetrahydrofolate reductase [Halalkalibacter sp. AB-rgal2]|uniref:bifunctional homocysteine S-methyltransferase/methylenetetrahydrofolate reductase n=1 Tax=Halalkalibacter sp. AB-rgal2 TaxID=3242695 RepID=UPI00359D5855